MVLDKFNYSNEKMRSSSIYYMAPLIRQLWSEIIMNTDGGVKRGDPCGATAQVAVSPAHGRPTPPADPPSTWAAHEVHGGGSPVGVLPRQRRSQRPARATRRRAATSGAAPPGAAPPTRRRQPPHGRPMLPRRAAASARAYRRPRRADGRPPRSAAVAAARRGAPPAGGRRGQKKHRRSAGRHWRAPDRRPPGTATRVSGGVGATGAPALRCVRVRDAASGRRS